MKGIPTLGASERDIIAAIRQLIQGRSNAVVSITLRANETTTTFVGPNVNENAEAFLSPKTASAAAAYATTYASISRIGTVPTVTITHASDSSTDRTFALAVLGG